MTIFRVVLQIMYKNKLMILMGLVISLATIFFISNSFKKVSSEPLQGKMSIIEEQSSDIGQVIKNYLGETNRIVSLSDTTEKGIEEALYFHQTDYILWLPADLEETLATDKPVTLQRKSRGGTFSQVLIDGQIDQFIDTYRNMKKGLPKAEASELLAKTSEVLMTKGEIVYDDTYTERSDNMLQATLYNILAYGLFMSIFSCFGAVSLSFNRQSIAERNSLSPVPKHELQSQIRKGTLLTISGLSVICIGFIFWYSHSDVSLRSLLLLINACIFTVALISLSSLMTSIIKHPETLSGVSNVLVLGTCFIGGVFVPSSMLPNVVSRIASFTPTYWFTQGNLLIGKNLTFTHEFYREYLLKLGMLLLFSFAFLVIQMMLTHKKTLRAN